MKKIVAIFIFFIILLQAFSQLVIVAGFYANRDYIARNLCENRDKPQMHCNGKCCLKKKLEKEAKEHSTSSRNQKNQQVINLFCDEIKFTINQTYFSGIPDVFFSFNDLHTFTFHHSVFHPPTV